MSEYECAEYEKAKLTELVFDLHVLTDKDIKKANRFYKSTDYGQFLKDECGNTLKVGDLAVSSSTLERPSKEMKGYKNFWVSRYVVTKWLEEREARLIDVKSYCIESGLSKCGVIEGLEFDIEIMKSALEKFKIQENNKDLDDEIIDMPMGL